MDCITTPLTCVRAMYFARALHGVGFHHSLLQVFLNLCQLIRLRPKTLSKLRGQDFSRVLELVEQSLAQFQATFLMPHLNLRYLNGFVLLHLLQESHALHLLDPNPAASMPLGHLIRCKGGWPLKASSSPPFHASAARAKATLIGYSPRTLVCNASKGTRLSTRTVAVMPCHCNSLPL